MPDLTPTGAPALYSADKNDPTVHAVYYQAEMGWSWFLLEYDPQTDTAYGLVDGFFEELGYWTLADLKSVGCERVECEPGPLSSVRLRTAA